MKQEKTHISCRISGEVFTLLEEAERERGESRTRIVEQALLAFLNPTSQREKGPITTKEPGLLDALEGLTIQATRIANLLEQTHTESHSFAHKCNTSVLQNEHTAHTVGTQSEHTDAHTDAHERHTEPSPPAAISSKGKKTYSVNATRVIYQGEERILLELLRELGIADRRNAIRKRMDRGSSAEEAITMFLPTLQE